MFSFLEFGSKSHIYYKYLPAVLTMLHMRKLPDYVIFLSHFRSPIFCYIKEQTTTDSWYLLLQHWWWIWVWKVSWFYLNGNDGEVGGSEGS